MPQPSAPVPPAAPVAPGPNPDQVTEAANAFPHLDDLHRAAEAAPPVQGAVPRTLPRTRQEVAGVREQRKALSDQLVSAQERRKDVARALERAENPANRAGLEQRLGVLDRRILQLEEDMAETGRLLTSASPALLAGQQVPFRLPSPDRGPSRGAVAVVFIMFVLFPLVLTFGRRFLRGPAMHRPDPLARESAERLGRLEQAVEAIAIEVERVSEGQRFVTRLLSETRPAAAQAPAITEYRPN